MSGGPVGFWDDWDRARIHRAGTRSSQFSGGTQPMLGPARATMLDSRMLGIRSSPEEAAPRPASLSKTSHP